LVRIQSKPLLFNMKRETLTLKMPKTCCDCIFNYDGIQCTIFKKRYAKDYDDTFDPYEERPEWCQWDKVTIKF